MFRSITLCVALVLAATPLAGAAEVSMTDVAFTAACDGTTQHYVVLLPPDFDKEKPHHLMVALHGHGSDRWQFAKNTRDECRAVRDAAAGHNMILVTPDYRAKTSWMGPKAEADMLQILSELKQRYTIGKTFLTGGSMGGSSALTFAALHPDLIDGVFSMNGTANHIEYENFQDAIRASFGGTKQEIPEEYKKRSAEYWPERFTMPVAITASGKDTSVPPASVLRLADVLKKMGRDVTVIFAEEEGHSTNYTNATTALEGLIEKVLDGSSDAGANAMPESFTNSIAMRFVRIEAGRFTMGQGTGGDWDERPVHEVEISSPFYMSAGVVTNSLYELFDPEHRKLRGKKGFSRGDDEAAVFVSWHDAVEFCEWLTEKEKKPYRLPTEAEWEYACRAGTTTPYHTGDTLPETYHRHQKTEWEPVPVDLTVGGAEANDWGLHGMHGKVEEWCHDWYGPYEPGLQTDPVGRADGDFRVTRGGSHGTELTYLRSANRSAALPEDLSWFIGFRVVQAPSPETEPLPCPTPELWARDVAKQAHDWKDGPAADKPYFEGPRRYVKVPPDSNGPMYSKHNHCPAITVCPNGDLLAIWYSTNTEPGRELAILASRLRHGSADWEPAAPFWNVPDRNDHASALLWDEAQTLYHFNGCSTDATWGKLALLMRTSMDSGATWSKAVIIHPEHQLRNMPIAGVFRTREGHFVLPCDAVTGGEGGSAIHISRDHGHTWTDPGAGKPAPTFEEGATGAWIAGIHAGVAQLGDGSLMALGRGNDIGGTMPKSISKDWGESWTYSASGLPSISGGQRLVLRRLKEGPLLLVSFTDSSKHVKDPAGMLVKDAAGKERLVYGLFAALSFDDGKTWPIRKLVTPGGDTGAHDGGAWTGRFTLDATHAEPKGYLAAVQAPDGVIHLISSALHYEFNLAWLKEPMAAEDTR